MRKICAGLLSVLLVAMSAVPAFALDRPDLKDHITHAYNRVIQELDSALVAQYPYFAVFTYLPDSNKNLGFVFSEFPNVASGSNVFRVLYNASNDTVGNPTAVSKATQIGIYDYSGTNYLQVSPVLSGYRYYIADIGTATFNANFGSYIIYVNIADLTVLNEILAEAKAKTDIGYTAESWQALQEKIAEGQSLNKYSGQDVIDRVISEIRAAIDGLELTPPPPPPPAETGVLSALVSQAEGLIMKEYTAASWSALQTVLSSARSLLSGNSTQAQVDEAAAALKAAFDGLILYDGPPLDLYDPILDGVIANVAVIVPVGLSILGLMIGLSIIPRIVRRFT